jgi:NitT/TauT family transport system substrate-binding protein
MENSISKSRASGGSKGSRETAALSRRTVLAGAAGSLVLATGFARTTSAQAREKLRLLIATSPPDPACHFFFYARDNSFYEKHGLDIDMKTITAETTTMRALLAGEGDIAAFVGATTALQAYSVGGGKVRCISAFAPKLDYQIIATKDIANLKQLEGRSFGISQVGTVSQFVPSLMLKKSSADPSKIKWVSIGNSAARLQGVIGKRVDASAVNASLAKRGLTYDYLHLIGDAAEMLPDFVYTWEITTAEIAKQKAGAIKAFIEATSEGVRWSMANPDRAIAISQKVLPDIGKDEISFAIKHYIDQKAWNANGILPESTWKFTAQAVVDAGLIKEAPSYDEFVVK